MIRRRQRPPSTGRGFVLRPAAQQHGDVLTEPGRVRDQIGTLSSVASSFLIPDNHIGRATVSSVAVAHEVESMGGRSIACLNSRDRNLLGFQRDLLTAAAYGVDQFLFVYGDNPAAAAAPAT